MVQNPTNWRLDFARALIRRITDERLLDAFVGGSVAKGQSDEWSDLELTLIWKVIPPVDNRAALYQNLGGMLELASDKEPADETVYLGNLQTDFHHTSAVELLRLVTEVGAGLPQPLRDFDTLYNLRHGLTLMSSGVVAELQGKISYPQVLRIAVIEENLKFISSGNISMHAARSDHVVLYGLFSGFAKRILNILDALNGEFYGGYKHFLWHLGELSIKPRDAERRFKQLFHAPPAEAAKDMLTLLHETLELVASTFPEINLEDVRQRLKSERSRIGDSSAD